MLDISGFHDFGAALGWTKVVKFLWRFGDYMGYRCLCAVFTKVPYFLMLHVSRIPTF